MLNDDRANFLRRAAARDAGDGAAAQQLAARFDVGSGKQHTAGSGHVRHAAAAGGCRGPQEQAAAGGRRSRQQQVAAGGRSERQAARGHGEGVHGGAERKA